MTDIKPSRSATAPALRLLPTLDEVRSTWPVLNPAALDALARADEGITAQPGDRALIADLERNCQEAAADYMARINEREHADWLAQQCPVCEPGGGGVVCDECPLPGGDLAVAA